MKLLLRGSEADGEQHPGTGCRQDTANTQFLMLEQEKLSSIHPVRDATKGQRAPEPRVAAGNCPKQGHGPEGQSHVARRSQRAPKP